MANTPMVLRSEVEDSDEESFYELTDESDDDGLEDEEGVIHVHVGARRSRRKVKRAGGGKEGSGSTPAKRAKPSQNATNNNAKPSASPAKRAAVKPQVRDSGGRDLISPLASSRPNIRSPDDAVRFANRLFRAADHENSSGERYISQTRNVDVTVFGAGGRRLGTRVDAQDKLREAELALEKERTPSPPRATISSYARRVAGLVGSDFDAASHTVSTKADYTYSLSPSYRHLTAKGKVGTPTLGRRSIHGFL